MERDRDEPARRPSHLRRDPQQPVGIARSFDGQRDDGIHDLGGASCAEQPGKGNGATSVVSTPHGSMLAAVSALPTKSPGAWLPSPWRIARSVPNRPRAEARIHAQPLDLALALVRDHERAFEAHGEVLAAADDLHRKIGARVAEGREIEGDALDILERAVADLDREAHAAVAGDAVGPFGTHVAVGLGGDIEEDGGVAEHRCGERGCKGAIGRNGKTAGKGTSETVDGRPPFWLVWPLRPVLRAVRKRPVCGRCWRNGKRVAGSPMALLRHGERTARKADLCCSFGHSVSWHARCWGCGCSSRLQRARAVHCCAWMRRSADYSEAAGEFAAAIQRRSRSPAPCGRALPRRDDT